MLQLAMSKTRRIRPAFRTYRLLPFSLLWSRPLNRRSRPNNRRAFRLLQARLEQSGAFLQRSRLVCHFKLRLWLLLALVFHPFLRRHQVGQISSFHPLFPHFRRLYPPLLLRPRASQQGLCQLCYSDLLSSNIEQSLSDSDSQLYFDR